MAAAIGLRDDFDACALRAIAKRSKDGPQARRLLALAAIYDGATRSEAAKIGGVGLQVVRDWVLRFNALGHDGLIDRKAPGQPSRLGDEHRAALARMIEVGDPRRRALADRRPLPVVVRGISRHRLRADPEPRVAQDGLSQTLGPSAPSRASRGSHRRI
jgi:Winged helix-turn helix